MLRRQPSSAARCWKARYGRAAGTLRLNDPATRVVVVRGRAKRMQAEFLHVYPCGTRTRPDDSMPWTPGSSSPPLPPHLPFTLCCACAAVASKCGVLLEIDNSVFWSSIWGLERRARDSTMGQSARCDCKAWAAPRMRKKQECNGWGRAAVASTLLSARRAPTQRTAWQLESIAQTT
eukprot:6205788-Pleurochrysis_carterae.AAC.3